MYHFVNDGQSSDKRVLLVYAMIQLSNLTQRKQLQFDSMMQCKYGWLGYPSKCTKVKNTLWQLLYCMLQPGHFTFVGGVKSAAQNK